MEDFFEKLQSQIDIKLLKSQSKWWNGHAFLPLHKYHFSYEYEGGIIVVDYEFRQSEFIKASILQGVYSDRHICYISCRKYIKGSFPKFTISERSIASKLFIKNSDNLFSIRCKDSLLSERLKQNKLLNKIFAVAEESSEFSPLIRGFQDKSGHYVITIGYNTQQKNEECLILLIDFCKELLADNLK